MTIKYNLSELTESNGWILCRFYKYWQTHEEYERERKAKAGK